VNPVGRLCPPSHSIRELYWWIARERYACNLTKTPEMVTPLVIGNGLRAASRRRTAIGEEGLAHGRICAIGAKLRRGEVRIDGLKATRSRASSPGNVDHVSRLT
jgi:hypothetical protein